jgi:mono/diheme cytochrome c family protein
MPEMPLIRPALRIGAAAGLWLCLLGTAQAGGSAPGKRIYDSRCAFCHGGTGKGDGPAGAALKPPPTNFASTDFWKSTNAEQIKSSIANGKPGTAMVGFKASLSGEQIDDLLTYLRTLQSQ